VRVYPTAGPNIIDINIIGKKSLGFVADTASAIGNINRIDSTKPLIIEFFDTKVFEMIHVATNQNAIIESILYKGASTRNRGIKSNAPAIRPIIMILTLLFIFHFLLLNFT
jgi:hypothetical protein